MALSLSLRRTLLILIFIATLAIMVIYWHQGDEKPQFLFNSLGRSLEKFPSANSFPIPVEKSWTYKCEENKCVRYHYPTGTTSEGRIPFMTCSMTCGDINIWPHPTIKSVYSSKSLTFSVKDVQLTMNIPSKALKQLFTDAFDLFLHDLRRIQRINYMKNANDAKEYLDKGDDKSSQTDMDSSNNDELPAVAAINEILGHCILCDIKKFIVEVTIDKASDTNLNLNTDESYELRTTCESHAKLYAKIKAKSFFGARHALSTLQQLIWYDDESHLLRTLSKAIIVDMPKFSFRGLMLDTSRHYFSVSAIKRTIRAMSHTKLNRFHWHISDSQSFPFISKHYPELASYGAYSERETYTAEDVREIADFAKLNGILVIPEIDAPAHAGNGWEWGPKHGLGELSLCINQQPWSDYCGEPPCGQLNPKNNNTYLILQRLYEELLSLTGPTDYFHLGGDEVNLDCWAQYFNDTDLRGVWCDFMLSALARLKMANNNHLPKMVSVWSSALTNTKCLSNEQFAVQVWGGSSWQENYDLIDNGFNVVFSHVDAWYLDCGFGNWRGTGEAACSPYRTWQTIYKHRPWKQMRLNNLKLKQVLGGEACLWTEQVEEQQLDNRLWPRTAALGERLWSDPDEDNYMEIMPQNIFNRMSIFRNRLVELGYKAEPLFPKYCTQNPGECI